MKLRSTNKQYPKYRTNDVSYNMFGCIHCILLKDIFKLDAVFWRSKLVVQSLLRVFNISILNPRRELNRRWSPDTWGPIDSETVKLRQWWYSHRMRDSFLMKLWSFHKSALIVDLFKDFNVDDVNVTSSKSDNILHSNYY